MRETKENIIKKEIIDFLLAHREEFTELDENIIFGINDLTHLQNLNNLLRKLSDFQLLGIVNFLAP